MTVVSDNYEPPLKIWDWILSNLQQEMSRAWFETWVKPAVPLSFAGGVFTLGCHNQYTIDWLNSRLKATIERQLSGMTGQPVELTIVLLSDVQMEDEEQDDNPEPGEVDVISDNTYEPVYASLRDALLQPERVVKMPVYFLRWLPYVGTRTIFEVVGIWQEYYLSSRGKQPAGGEKVATRIENVCRWAGVSRAQLFRDFGSVSSLNWFVGKIETDHERNRQTGRSKKSANKYALYGIPLTPGDAEDLAAYLQAKDIQRDPLGTLRQAIAAQPNEILRYTFRAPPENFKDSLPRRITVQDVVKSLVGRRLEGEVSHLADQLSDRLLAPGDFILISWYFLQNWLPLLASATASNVPPYLVKGVIAAESQFWPAGDWMKGEISLGQMTASGADLLLSYRPNTYRQVCAQVFGEEECGKAYQAMAEDNRALLRGWVLGSLDVTCPTCTGGIDASKGTQAVAVLAETLAASCSQSARVIRMATGKTPASLMSYEDYWRFTLANYHSGSGCMYQALRRSGNPTNWPAIASGLPQGCSSGQTYVRRVEENIAP